MEFKAPEIEKKNENLNSPEVDSLIMQWLNQSSWNEKNSKDENNKKEDYKSFDSNKNSKNNVSSYWESESNITYEVNNWRVEAYVPPANNPNWPRINIPVDPSKIVENAHEKLQLKSQYEEINNKIESSNTALSNLDSFENSYLLYENPWETLYNFILSAKLNSNLLVTELTSVMSEYDEDEIDDEEFKEKLVAISKKASDALKANISSFNEEKSEITQKSIALSNSHNKDNYEYKKNAQEAEKRFTRASFLIENSIASCLRNQDFQWLVDVIIKNPNNYAQINLSPYTNDIFNGNFDLWNMQLWEHSNHINIENRERAFLAFFNYIISWDVGEPMKDLDWIIRWTNESYSSNALLISSLKVNYPDVFLNDGRLNRIYIEQNLWRKYVLK